MRRNRLDQTDFIDEIDDDRMDPTEIDPAWLRQQRAAWAEEGIDTLWPHEDDEITEEAPPLHVLLDEDDGSLAPPPRRMPAHTPRPSLWRRTMLAARTWFDRIFPR